MEIGSLCLNPRGYLKPMTALAHRVAIGKHEVSYLLSWRTEFVNPAALLNDVSRPAGEVKLPPAPRLWRDRFLNFSAKLSDLWQCADA